MSRVDRFRNLDKDPHYGLFNAVITKIDEYKVSLRDILTDYTFEIDFNLSSDLQTTLMGKQIWINQIGEVGYGPEHTLLTSFTHFYKSDQKKEYRLAKNGEVLLFDFLRNLHNLNPFDTNSTLFKSSGDYIEDSYYFRELFLNDHNSNPTIGGIMYVDEQMNQKIYSKFIPSHKLSIIKNVKGDFTKINDYLLKDITSTFLGNYQPRGYYHWDNITQFVLPIIPKLNESDI